MDRTIFDLAHISGYKVNVTSDENAEERAVRLVIEKSQSDLALWKEKTTFVVAVIGYTVVSCASLYLVTFSDNIMKVEWAMKALYTLLTATGGVFVGRASKK